MSNNLVVLTKKQKIMHNLNSLNIAPGKGACKNFQTFYETGNEIYYFSKKETYKRKSLFGDKGDPKLKKYMDMNPLYKNIATTWEAISSTPQYSDWLQTSTGMNHLRRDVIVLDFDANKFIKGGYHSITEAETDVKGFVTKFKLPNANYIYYNKTSGNIQVGWFLGRYLNMSWENERYRYLKTGRALNEMWAQFKGLPGDVHFTGWQCKNPFNHHASNGSVIYSKEPISTDVLIEATIPYWPKVTEKVKKAKKTHVGTIKGKHFADIETSRDAYESKGLREWVWSYMRKNRNEEPSFQQAMEAMYELAAEASEITGKPQHDIQELTSICKNTLNWAVKNYNPLFQTYTDEQRRFAKLYNNAQKYFKYLQANKLNGPCRKVAEKIGCSPATISRLRNLSDQEIKRMEMLFVEYQAFIEVSNKSYHNNKKNKYSLLIMMILKFNEIKELITIKIKEYKSKLASLNKFIYNKRDETENGENYDSPGSLASLALSFAG